MDHAFGFKTDDVRSKHTRFLSFIYLFSFFFLFFFFYLLIVWLFYFLINHEIFTNFARAEFECMFSFVSPLFIALL